AVHSYVVGSLPWVVRMLGFLAGFRGDRREGIEGIRKVAAEGSRTQVEAQVILALVYRREKEYAKAIPILEDLASRFPRNYLYRMELVNVLLEMDRDQDVFRQLKALEQYPNLPGAKLAKFRSSVENQARAR
ncbi:MAG: tetratricopeptide repeat protein, partial [Bryobacteraceae bacterium]